MKNFKSLFWLLVMLTTTALFVMTWLEQSLNDVPAYYYIENQEDNEDQEMPQAETKYRALPIRVKIPGSSCEHPHPEWERLGEDLFFKREGAFVFPESGYAILLLAGPPSTKIADSQNIPRPRMLNSWVAQQLEPFDLVFDARLSGGGVELSRKRLDKFDVVEPIPNAPPSPHLSSYYVSISIEPVRTYLDEPDLVFEMHVSTKRGARVRRPLIVKVKWLNKPGKKYAAVGRCVDFGMDDTEVPAMEAWLRLQRSIGFERVVLYNNSMHGKATHELFARYSDFVDIVQFECYPRFDNGRGEFFSRTNNPWANIGDHLFTKYSLNMFSFLELYFDLVDQFEYVSLFDLDEMILPRRIKQVFPHLDYAQPINIDPKRDDVYEHAWSQLSVLEAQCSKSKLLEPPPPGQPNMLREYTEQLRVTYALTQEACLAFGMVTMFEPRHAVTFMLALEDFFASKKFRARTSDTFEVNMREYKISNPSLSNIDLRITFNDASDVAYGQYLVQLYRHVLGPFLMKNERKLRSMPHMWQRFFYLDQLNVDLLKVMLKSIHSTLGSVIVYSHAHAAYPPLDRRSGDGKELYHFINTSYGFLSHFRYNYEGFYISHLKGILPVKSLRFDYDYFLCYFKPLLDELSEL